MTDIQNVSIKEWIMKLNRHKYRIITNIILCGFIGFIISISLPSKYTVSICLSPEYGNSRNNNLAGMASVLGIGGLNSSTQDAINTELLPEIIATTPFLLDMYNLEIETSIYEKKTLLSNYIINEKEPWWKYIISPHSILNLFTEKDNKKNSNETINPFQLTKEQFYAINKIKDCITATVDNQTNLTTISVTLQNPNVAAYVADCAVKKLQKYIIDYRTQKAKEDAIYLEKLRNERKEQYITAQQNYAKFVDSNRNIIQQKAQAEGIRLQNEMSIAFQIYSQIETQLQIAQAKIQEIKPVFAIVEPATIPLYPSFPNKKLLIIGLMFLGLITTLGWILFGKGIWNDLKRNL